MTTRRLVTLLIALVGASLLLASALDGSASFARITAEQIRTYRIDPPQSKIEVKVFKAGWLKAFGHDHLIVAKDYSGTVRVSPTAIEQASVNFEIKTDSFTVLDPWLDTEDRQTVERDMKSDKVLHVSEHPHITFTSTKITDVKPSGDRIRLTLTGNLSLHGVTHQLSTPIEITLKDDSLRTQGSFNLKQSDYNIKPISVKAALGGIRVKDQIQINFDLVARREGDR